jgi:hypothetical protein
VLIQLLTAAEIPRDGCHENHLSFAAEILFDANTAFTNNLAE